MSNSKSSKHDENANTHMVGTNGHDDLSNYAQDALKEVLGWYGLHEGSEGGPGSDPTLQQRLHVSGHGQPPKLQAQPTTSQSLPTAPGPLTQTSSHDSNRTCTAAKMVVKPEYDSLENTPLRTQLAPTQGGPRPNGREDPLDLTNGHGPLAEMANNNGGSSKVSWAGHRKLIGMRFLFPPLSDDMSLLDRARIWVRRHDHKYFVGWTDDQLKDVEPILRPIGTITPDKYKLHMNRSEHCRNVKLKYCLESSMDWAEEFREKLRKPASAGGFTGLCQVKIAAAELWRQYSENYRSHQARYPNPKSKYRSRHAEGDGGNDSDTSSKRKSSADDSLDLDDEGFDDSQEAKRGRLEDEYDLMCDDEEIDPGKMSCDSEEGQEMNEEACYREEAGGDVLSQEPEVRRQMSSFETSREDRGKIQTVRSPPQERATIEEPQSVSKAEEPHTPSESSTSGLSPMILTPEQIAGRSFFPHFPGTPTYLGMPMPMYPPPGSPFALGLRGEPHFPLDAPMHLKLNPSAAETITSSALNFVKPKLSERHQHEYKRSERGLSFLFPSLSDHNLSLLDKVKITVIRHKNNYFLGKCEEELNKIDPLIRPKMVVTVEIYKEYCHRNAMKYDSNLQFAMESPESWAHEFRAKLMRPPSEGGFSSLCEVKLEAGRLWREYSGKYRMHNIVKWQMDLNNATKVPKQETDDRQRQLSPSSPVENQDPDLRGSKIMSPQSSTESLDPYSAVPRAPCNINTPKPDEVSSSSPKTVLSDSSLRAASGSGAPMEIHAEPHPRLGSDSSSGSGTSRKLRGHITSKSSQYEPSRYSLNKTGASSTAEVTPDISETSRIPISPQEVTRPRLPERPPDALFKPLPRTLSVAEQLSVWLERHRYNYFLGFPKEDLVHLNELVCPSTPVTEDIFKKYVPESMVDVLSKIELIMLSTEPWAIDFQDKVHKPAKDGGFSTFEEALTEAVVLWNMAKTSYHQHMGRDNRPRLATRPDQLDIARQSPTAAQNLSSPAQHPIKTEAIESPRQGPHHTMSPASILRYQMESHHAYMSKIQPQPTRKPLDRPPTESPSPRQTQVPAVSEDRGPAPQRVSEVHGDTPATTTAKDLKQRPGKAEDPRPIPVMAPGLAPSILWPLRDQLQKLCSDQPNVSWSDRLEPHLTTLKANVGPGYMFPASNTGCVVDLALATIHEHVQHITNLLASRQERPPDRSDGFPSFTS